MMKLLQVEVEINAAINQTADSGRSSDVNYDVDDDVTSTLIIDPNL